MSAEDDAIVWLRGFLHASEWFNHKTNYVASYTIDVLPKPETVRQAIETHFAGDLAGLMLSPIEDWPSFLRGFWGRWLFQFKEPTMDHLVDPREAFSLFDDSFREQMLDEVINRLSGTIHPTAVWSVRIETRTFYGCDYEDMVLEEPTRVLYLHAGWSD